MLILTSGAIYHGNSADSPFPQQQMVPLHLRLPAPESGSVLVDMPDLDPAHVETPNNRPRAPLMVPAGTTNLAVRARVTSSDRQASHQALQTLADRPTHDKVCGEDFLVISPGPQWVQIDLGAEYPIYAVVIWHSCRLGGWIFHGVVVQAASDGEFKENVQTVFNNDYKNLVGLGAGKDKEYFETHEGKLLALKGQVARYLRFYSAGSTRSRKNHYFGLEVYGLPSQAP